MTFSALLELVTIVCCLILSILLFLPVTTATAQTVAGFQYTTQLTDTLPHLAEKYLGDPNYAESIILATEQVSGLTIADPLPPGLTLFIPFEPIAEAEDNTTASPPESQAAAPPTVEPTPIPAADVPAAGSGPEPFGKIAFSFFNRAIQRRIWEIDLIRADGSEHQIFRWNEVSEPAISPDGNYLAFRGWHDTGHVLSVGPLSGERYWPIGSFQEDSRPDWSHDGSRLVFSSQRESDRLWRLYFVHANGEGERVLSRIDGLPLHGEDPAWSHGDDRIIYRGCAPTGENCGLWFITLDGAVSAPIVVDSDAIQPDGSPSEDRVVYSSKQSGNWELYTVNIDGTDLRQLTNDPGIDGMPTWSPDGEWIAFLSTRAGFAPDHPFEQGPTQGGQSTEDNWGIWLIRKDGTDLRQIFAFDGGLMKANRLDLPYGSRDWYDEQISWGQ